MAMEAPMTMGLFHTSGKLSATTISQVWSMSLNFMLLTFSHLFYQAKQHLTCLLGHISPLIVNMIKLSLRAHLPPPYSWHCQLQQADSALEQLRGWDLRVHFDSQRREGSAGQRLSQRLRQATFKHTSCSSCKGQSITLLLGDGHTSGTRVFY